MDESRLTHSLGPISRYIRRHHLGLIAIFIAMTGTAVATTAVTEQSAQVAKKKKAKPRPGPAGPQGPQGPQGPAGSPDTPAQVLGKLATVDGPGSGLDSDLLDGLSSAALQRRGTSTSCPGGEFVLDLEADGDVACSPDRLHGTVIDYLSSTPTPSVQGASVVRFTFSSAMALTDLTGESPGQVVVLIAGNANVSIADAGNFALSAAWAPGTDDTLTLASFASEWYEVARSNN